MIHQLDPTIERIAKDIYKVFQASYKIEAALLGADDFPPLKRIPSDFMQSTHAFYGYLNNNTILGVVEVKKQPDYIHIQSLVVDPDHFRKGIGNQLMRHVEATFSSPLYVVETGLDNGPATKLYESLGYLKTHEWKTEIGIWKVRMEKKRSEENLTTT